MMEANTKKRSLSGYLVLGAKGFCMGASDVVPGVSGGTMAFILGIYDELIGAIRSFDLVSVRLLVTLRIRSLLDRVSWQFLLSLGIGIMTAIFSLAKALSWLLENKPVLIWSFFLGLILASVVSVSRRVETWGVPAWLSLTAGTIATYFLVGIVPVSTPNNPLFLFLCGAIAICAMILPGISGSFILVLLGKYRYVLCAVNDRDFLVLALVAAGACAGIIAFSRFLGWLLNNYHDLTVGMLIGLMLGSLRKVWPWKETVESMVDLHGKIIPIVQSNILPEQLNGQVIAAIALMAAGLLAVLLLDRMAARNKE